MIISRLFQRTLLVYGVIAAFGACDAWAQPPEVPGYPKPVDRGPGPYFTGSDSRGYPYYAGYRYFPAYPLYRAYPDYLSYPSYPRDSYNAGYQPSHACLMQLFGLRPPLWRFQDYYSGNYPTYYWGTPDYRNQAPVFAGLPAPAEGVMGPYPAEQPAAAAPASSTPPSAAQKPTRIP